jgi:predicted phosphoribosyltransferase
MIEEFLTRVAPLFVDRTDAGKELAVALRRERSRTPLVVGLARGGVVVAAEVARALEAPLDVVAVRKISHPRQLEYGLGAVTPGEDGVYLRSSDGLGEEEVAEAVEAARRKAALLDRRLHAEHDLIALAGRTVLVVDDGLATGGTMIAALRWARAAGAARIVAAVPVAAEESLALIRNEADEVVCPHPLSPFLAVGAWYARFEQVADEAVLRLLAENRQAVDARWRELAPKA